MHLCLFALHSTLKPRGRALLASCQPISTPQKPERCCHGPAVCLTLSQWTEKRRRGGQEVRMDIDSLWRVHLFNLCIFWTMFRLGRSPKYSTLVSDDRLAGEICIAKILRGLKPSFAFSPDLSADSKIYLTGRTEISLKRDSDFGALRRLKGAWK